MGFFSSLFGIGKNDSTSSVKTVDRVQKNRLKYITNNRSEELFSVARCENGVVYCCANSEFVVGSYEESEDGKIIVWNDDHTYRIGEICEEKRQICLLTTDLYLGVNKFRHVNMPKSFIMFAAKWSGNYIIDEDTNQVVASFEGDAVAAAAAFVCLTYEVLTNNKYHEYYHEWLR